MLKRNKLLVTKNNKIIGKTAAAAKEARLEYLNKVAVVNQVNPAAKPIGQAKVNTSPKNVATPLPPLNRNQIG
jgi:hypothetical protein